MLPSFGKLTRRQIATLTLAAAVVTAGVYQAGSRLAQVGVGADLCIEAMGPFFPELPSRIDSGSSGSFRKEGLAAFPDGKHFLKSVGGNELYLYSVDASGVVRRLSQVAGGPYKHVNVAVLDDEKFVIAYTSGTKGYARVGQLTGDQVAMGVQKEFTDVPQAYENRIVYAIDRMTPTKFVVVTDVPATEPSPLQAIVGQVSGTDVQWQTQRTVVPERYDPRSTGASFDVAGYGANDFIVAFADASGGTYARAKVTATGMSFRAGHTLGANVRSVDLASTFGTPRVVLGYGSRSDTTWRVQAGEITITSSNEQFGPINVESVTSLNAVAVSWINDDTYVVGLSDGKGVYLHQGTHGGSSVAQRIYVSDDDDAVMIAVSGSAGAPGRAVIAQSTADQATAGITATYCPACGNGKQEVGEQCDDGNQVNDDQCSNSCESPTCDDGIVQIGEVCNADVPMDDEPICDPRFCGNDQMDPGEQCDDGNNLDGDECDPLCRVTCDDDADCPSGECAGGVCVELCGNGVVDPPICVSDGGGLDCPPPNPNDIKTVYLPGDVFATGHANGDLNKDGKIDIVVGYYMGNGTKSAQGSYNGIIEAYINQGNGTFAAKKFVANFQWNDGGGQRGLDIVDADNDGDGDVVVYDANAQGIAVYRNDNLTFTKSHTIPDYFAFYLSHGDVNKDGDPELGLVGFKLRVSGTYENSVFKGANATTFATPPTLLSGSTGYDTMRFADMDNDGDQDLVISTASTVSGSFGYRLSTFLSNGDGTFSEPVTMFERGANPNVLSMSIGDANGDGKKDVALGENGNTIVVVLGDGRGGALSNAVINTPFHTRFVAFADPSADGKLDLVFTPGLGTEGKNIWMMKGSGDGLSYDVPERFVTVSPPASGRPPFTWNSSYYYNYDLKSADYDGDGRLDLSVTHALSSDGASVILFRSSIDGCTQIPPVITCSQPEECDDGSLNGQPGKCTRRCTLCGNGVIDTVNNVTEACDDGDQNGESGSTCSLRCTRIENDRLGCVGKNQCGLVPVSSDAPACQNAADCPCNPADPTCNPTHPGCVDNACVPTTDPFAEFCDTNADCAPCPPSNPNCHEQCSPQLLQCVATPAGSCTDAECADQHFTCVNQACTILPGPQGTDPVCNVFSDCARCGNGVTEPDLGEQCDDGNQVNDDLCTNTCKRYCVDDRACPCDEGTHECNGSCGDQRVDIGEACDEGQNNRIQPPELLKDWYCKALSCTISSCFDNGDNDHDQFTDNLDPGCWRYDLSALRPKRGGILGFLLAQNTIITPVEPQEFLAGKDDEACPLEMVDMGAFCATTCDPGDICPNGDICPENGICPPVCGNSIIDTDLGEECDDGNLDNDDACTNQCRLPPCTGQNCPRCGDGVYQPELGEQCDGSDPPATVAQGCTQNCRLKCVKDDQCPGTCDEEAGLCVPAQCGDGEVNQPWERCDDGDINNDNECNNACQQTCNEDPDCDSGRCDRAQEICYPTCGNLHIDPGESCDDGNLIDNDACTNACQFHCVDDSTCDCDETIQQCRPMCGNGRIDPGEGCDDGNRVDRDECSNRCQVRCRPGTICPDSQACPQNGECPPPGFCGDGLVDGFTEQCDDGNHIDTDNCTNDCHARCAQNLECPNGLLCVGQECTECTNSLQCDAGFCVDGHCRQALPICGNGTVEPGEVCDDANVDDADGCTATCSFPIGHACVASAQCQTRLCQNSVCLPCKSEGQCGSGLRCSEGNCLFGGLQCGDGTVQAGEVCDDGNLIEQDQCTSACLLAFGESCGHASECASTICSGGSCTPCRADAECSGGTRCAIGMCLTNAQMALIPNICGNGMLEADEECDDGNNTFGDGCTPGCYEGNAPTRIEVAANMTVQMPFGAEGGEGPGGAYGQNDPRLHGGAGDNLSNSGPATVAVMAAGAAAGAAWMRRRFGKKR